MKFIKLFLDTIRTILISIETIKELENKPTEII